MQFDYTPVNPTATVRPNLVLLSVQHRQEKPEPREPLSQEYTEDKEVTLTSLSSGRRLLETLLILIVLFAVWSTAALRL
ncbi:hypothetical protein ACNKHW_05400 [Shigella flexneri]